MKTDEHSSSNRTPDTLGVNISHKLTPDDIEKIERYRQTKRTSVVTILFTDIEGFTGFTYRVGELISGKLRHIHDEIVITQVKKDEYGEIIKQIGDSFLIIFSDPTLAVKYAMRLQELFRLNSENLTYNDYTLKIRIGLHMGQVSVEDHIVSDVFSTHVNMASRIMSLAKGGQVLVSGFVWENASGWLKDEHEDKVFSIFYGKIKLKGIDKTTDIYEFYTEITDKIGIPKTILRRKQKVRILWACLIAILTIIIVIPIFPLLNKNSKTTIAENDQKKEKVLLADIDSYDSDIESTAGYFEEYPWSNSTLKNQFQSIDPLIIGPINTKYIERLKTRLFLDFDVETEEELKLNYSKKGLTVAKNLYDDKDTIIWTYFGCVMPHLYRCKGNNSYFMMLEINGNQTGDCFKTYILSDLDSVPFLIDNFFNEVIDSRRRIWSVFGEIIKITNNDILLGPIHKGTKPILIPGVVLLPTRTYAPYDNIKDSGVMRRLKDLEKAMEYYGTINTWIKNVDTNNQYYWTYKEYRDLKKGLLAMSAEGGVLFHLYMDLKVVKVNDSTVYGIIQNQKYPWIKLEIGDGVRLRW